MKTVTMFVWNNFMNDARVLREAKTLVDNGYRVVIIAKRDMNEKHLKKVERLMPGLTVLRPLRRAAKKPTNNSIIDKHLVNAWLMLRMIFIGRTSGASIYHAHDLNTLIQGVMSAKLRMKKRKLIYDSHEVQTSRTHYNTKLVRRIEGFLLKFVDHVIVENDTRADYHAELYGERPTPVHNYSELYNIETVEPVDLRGMFNIDEDKVLVLYQGGIQEGRGLPALIEAFAEIDDAVLIMIGDGKERDNIVNLRNELGLGNRVFFIDRVPYEDLRRYTKSADIGIQFLENTNFNHYSASSNKLFEYMMAGVPVIASDLPEMARVVKGEKIGLIVEPGSKESLIEALRTLITDDDLRKQFKENMSQAKLKYNWDVEQDQLLNVYASLSVEVDE
ncbi:MAG TPA: glycosyltransferase family 4 protein [Aliicoccus persicus]|uniref:Glycosyltransferase family 4 protein n=1 Tax=Aliicoccus persicus TaxID=930138 RepID=A0A921DXN4_9STAP|nr:glycosyltransferase family 4 protein [Aliicoccus persicus]